MTATILKLNDSAFALQVPATSYISKLNALANGLKKDNEAFKEALTLAKSRGLTPGQWVTLKNGSLGLISGYNETPFNVFPSHKFPLLVCNELGEWETALGHVEHFAGQCCARLFTGESVELIPVKKGGDEWKVVRRDNKPFDWSIVESIFPM